MLIGYSLGSTDHQTVDRQRDVFERQRSGGTLGVWRLDRLGRSLKYLNERAGARSGAARSGTEPSGAPLSNEKVRVKLVL